MIEPVYGIRQTSNKDAHTKRSYENQHALFNLIHEKGKVDCHSGFGIDKAVFVDGKIHCCHVILVELFDRKLIMIDFSEDKEPPYRASMLVSSRVGIEEFKK